MSLLPTSPSFAAKKRRWARRFAMQALYQWQMAGQELGLIQARFLGDADIGKVDTDYFHKLLYGVPQSLENLHVCLERYINRPINGIDPVELTLLRMATFELQECLDVPYRVILNEALELEKSFGATEGYRFVNGILDKVAREVRSHEIQAASSE